MISKRFSPNTKIYLGKTSTKNLKESIDLFLYESDKASDLDNVIRLKPFLDTFHCKGLKEN